jgi:hypothetical protein
MIAATTMATTARTPNTARSTLNFCKLPSLVPTNALGTGQARHNFRASEVDEEERDSIGVVRLKSLIMLACS